MHQAENFDSKDHGITPVSIMYDIHHGQIESEIPATQYRCVLLKIDLVVMPLIVIAMTLAFLDKNGLAYAAVYGLKTDTHLVGQQYSWLGSIFYFGYLAMEFPNLWLITKFPTGKYMGCCLMAWGACLCLLAACHNFAGLAVVRLFLGAFEAALLPCLLLMNSKWYRRSEQPLRTAFWYNTFAGVFGGILSYAIGHIKGDLPTWKYIFIIYGTVTILVGILVMFALPDGPSTAWFLSGEEKKIALLRVSENQTGLGSHRDMKPSQIFDALTDPRYYILMIFVIAQSITNAGITNFNPLIISGFGFSQAKTTLLATPQAAVAMVAQALCTTLTFFVPNIRCLIWVISSLIAMAGAIMVHILDPTTQRAASLAGVYIMGFYNVPWVIALSLQTSNTSGTTKKSFVSISVAIFYAIGNIIGPQFFLGTQAPHYPLGIGAMLCCFAIMTVTGILYFISCLISNQHRDRVHGRISEQPGMDVAGIEADMDDLTDRENNRFRYTY
ncbi:Major facilitator superfamily domain general substrate transporter [Penicillium canescens]|uniref:Major facilitator superfamily domain general substrate transporter n=1 Tax=Penicillium canescens TaxID=5083 RepID=A0AAD6N7I3_PENCN|nr:Major facilitator superfamily domain general substrate transporter [Penicillium canescens]KAJ6035617.1 Major facilitator superfamily domain general substrate transporter [Penicillium canescens]KAJ6037740.1 Major facilitator superfamily domain general substrate transporter [Penicillium canescens]KAJ6054367.1 Major facilitator superfamily domain general substrate transporter [Penicillium canescens]KAJ6098369.1 Major facilitator superfamily domain general substrate transporter [Penicillium cane